MSHPAVPATLTAFLLITFGVSWAGGLIWGGAVAPWAAPRGFFAQAYVPSLIPVLGPALAALLVTWVAGGAAATAALARQLRPHLPHWKWYLGLPLGGVALAGAAYVTAGVPFEVLGASLSGGTAAWLAAHFAVQVALVGLGEETGWRGWLLPHFAHTRRFGVATLLTVLVWTVWHGPKIAAGGAVAGILVVQLAAVGVILSWLWVRLDGNVFGLAVAHASVNAPVFFVEHVIELAPGQLLAGWRGLTVAYVVIAVALAIGSRGLWRQLGSPLRAAAP